MAKENLFERYGIKEVADVTFYRIERKSEMYEAQRKISVASILKGALDVQTVYPLEERNGKLISGDEGYEAYVFSGAEIRTNTDYACDDNAENVEVTYSWTPETKPSKTPEAAEVIQKGTITEGTVPVDVNDYRLTEGEVTESLDGTYTVTVTYTYISEGTHEFTYEEQVFMLFAKNQNLIEKSGTRYSFKNVGNLLAGLTFNDNFASAPNSSDRVVVVLLDAANGNIEQSEVEDVKDAIDKLTSTYTAKAYNVVYNDYAELIVEDEMGYYNDAYLGSYDKYRKQFTAIDKTTITDVALKNATMWGADTHESINDAIDALKEKRKTLDNSEDSSLRGLKSISGGYKVNSETPEVGHSDLENADNKYSYSGSSLNEMGTAQTQNFTETSNYSLDDVLKAVNEIARTAKANTDLMVTKNAAGETSNRAIYVRVGDAIDVSASAYIYILKNVNKSHLQTDEEGIFEFYDKEGVKRHYQDKIYAGTETLALVIIGTGGLIFVVNRYGTRNIEKIAWMISETGFINNEQAKRVAENGLLHTVDVTVEDETFEATCSVKSIAVRKINKKVNRYVPVLFLDTLKVSTIEQTAETTYAQGGRGNAQLIGWDFNKEITLTLQDALYTPASMSAMLGAYVGGDFTKGVKDTKRIDRTEKCTAERSFIVPAGNSLGVPSEGETSAQAVYIDLSTMQPYQDGSPIAEGEVYLKWTRSVAYVDNSIGNTIEISADKFPGTFKIVGDTYARSEATGEDQRFQFVIPKAKVSPETMTITLEADGEPTVFDMSITVLRPEDGIMMKLIQYDVVENTEERDGSTMVKNTENLNLLDDAEMYKVSGLGEDNSFVIGATEY